MWEWIASPVDPSRIHAVGFAVSWHGRSMVLAWSVLAPLAVIGARFLKILPWQDWPRELDNQLWWRGHWMGQAIVLLLTVFAIGLVLGATGGRGPTWHGAFGLGLLALLLLQVGLGVFRGSKGGPTAPARDGSTRGDHYDMTRWRRVFEATHKALGYALLGLAAVTILLGLWQANAPRWMWALIVAWWAALALLAVVLQRRGWAADTYEAIWGPDPAHPGNRMPPRGWGMRRRGISPPRSSATARGGKPPG